MEIDIDKLKKLVENGLKLVDISKEMDVSISTLKRKMAKNGIISKYYSNKSEEIQCLKCGLFFKALKAENRKFCSSSCSAIFNNPKKEKKKRIYYKRENRIFKEVNHGKCLNCESDIIRSDGRSTQAKYCSLKCQANFLMNERVLSNKASTRTLKLYLIKKYGEKCMECGWDKINPVTNKVPIELEHIDGDSLNNNLENLKLLCPNCHSLTPTYKALNIGNGRHSRRERYKEGKSF